VSVAQRLAWLDGLSLLAVLGAVVAVGLPSLEEPSALWLTLVRVAAVAAVCIVALYYSDLYDFDTPHDAGRLFARLCRALGVSALALSVSYVLFPGMILGGNLASHAIVLAVGAVLGCRLAVYALATREPFVQRVLLVGDGALARELAAQVAAPRTLALRLIGVLAPAPATAIAPHLGDYGDLEDVVRRYRPDRIIVALPDRRGRLPVTALLACRFRGIRIEDGPGAYERLTRRLAVESLTPSALIFGDGFRVSRAQLALKRVLSVAVAVAGLVATAPLLALLALAIRLESPGPVLFVQERIGWRGRPFRLLKLRTMRPADARTDEVWARDNATRVTRVGAVLRRYRLDEIPQFWNILRGDMSLVGPRPEMADNVAILSAAIPYYHLRHEVRPGLTGWAQVKAGYSMSPEEITRKLCYDLYYIKHLSLAFDLRILVDTVKFVLCGKRPG
jgi:exopolysaccharide biosynthesis polyprenyl glycosylphosphotransferase